jgi:hypothetical protein
LDQNLIARFEQEMMRLYEHEKREGRRHARFLPMLKKYGAINAAERLVATKYTAGLGALQESDNLDLSVEALVVKYKELFPANVIMRAQAKLDAIRSGRELPEEEAKVALKTLKIRAKATGISPNELLDRVTTTD